MVIGVLVSGFCLLAMLRGARLTRLATIGLRWPGLVMAGFGLQLAASSLFSRSESIQPQWLYLAGWILLLVFLGSNWRKASFRTLTVGASLNFAAIAANAGTMPMAQSAETLAGLKPESGRWYNAMVLENPKILFLGDIFALPRAMGPLAVPFSIGDVIIAVGFCLFASRVIFDESLDKHLISESSPN